MKKGFTFIEIIVVSAIFSILLLATYGVFHSGSMVIRRSKDIPTQERKIILALERLAQDLRAICPSVDFGVEEWQFKGSARQLSFVGFCNQGLCFYDYEFIPTSGKLSLTQYKVDREDEQLEKIKLRELIEELGDFNFEFMGYDRQLKSYFWDEEWEDERNLPVAVKAQLIYDEQTYTKKIFLLY
ncbi:MAG: prepilin-type N-terminal cleavage/methylation domain-containing protein [Candidatus Omnitrophota bacterium]|jgi:prepilin-type N-terminal cleavage/methylation domain-containing protein